MWFAGSGEVDVAADDSRGALPYDTYRLQELPVAANGGLKLVDIEVVISREAREVGLGTVTDAPGPALGTTLVEDPGGTHTAPADSRVALVDTVGYGYFEYPAEYTFRGELHLIAADGTDEGVVAEGEATRRVTLESGEVEVAFAVDTTGMQGKRLVAFERAYDADGNEVASHADPGDADQTVTVPGIGTTLTDPADGDHSAASHGGEVTLVDAVAVFAQAR